MSLKYGKFRELRNLQRLVVSSFTLRIRAVHEAIDFYKSNDLYTNSFFFTDSEKLLVVLNLKYLFLNPKSSTFLLSKKKHLSSFFEITDFHSTCLRVLFSYSILPFVETLSDRCSISFRPYRDCHDILYHLKINFFKAKNLLWFLKAKFFFDFKFNNWLSKNFPFNDFLRKSFFSATVLNLIEFNHYNFYFILINFLLDGLV